MQILLNRINLIAESKETISYMKWGVAIFVTIINIIVFSIWIPSHVSPPVNQGVVKANNHWDPISKVIICLLDATLNWYFLRVVQTRLLEKNGLMKYSPLVAYNAQLVIISVAMDISTLSLPIQRIARADINPTLRS